MSDLIKRSDVLETLESVFKKYNIAFGQEYGGFAEAVPETVKIIPTAYDVDKVEEQLQKQVDYYRAEARKNDNFPQIQHCRRLSERAYRNAIEIVKAGGVNAT